MRGKTNTPKEAIRRATSAAASETLEARMLIQIRALKLDVGMVREHRFDPDRRWRFDFAWPINMVALEVEGGTHSGGRHTRGKGFAADAEKYAHATLAGWRVFRTPVDHIKSGKALQWMQAALASKGMP